MSSYYWKWEEIFAFLNKHNIKYKMEKSTGYLYSFLTIKIPNKPWLQLYFWPGYHKDELIRQTVLQVDLQKWDYKKKCFAMKYDISYDFSIRSYQEFEELLISKGVINEH